MLAIAFHKKSILLKRFNDLQLSYASHHLYNITIIDIEK